MREWNDQVIFLRKILPGRADQSYGIQVARLAGLPDNVLNRAKRKFLTTLKRLSSTPKAPHAWPASTTQAVPSRRTRRKKAAIRETLGQLDLL